MDTSGIWFQGKSWPYFTTDWNIQSAHWPVYAANRLEQGQALVDRLHERREELIKAVRPVEWQEDSAYLPIAVAWDMSGTREGDMRYYDLVGNLPWTMHNLWMQYRYSMDDAMLREKIYPLLRRAINLYLHMVAKSADGNVAPAADLLAGDGRLRGLQLRPRPVQVGLPHAAQGQSASGARRPAHPALEGGGGAPSRLPCR